MRIQYNELKKLLYEKLLKYNFSENDAVLCSKIFADNSLFGVLSHGVNRFPAFIELIQKEKIKVNNKPTIVRENNAFQQWDGNFGPGPLNAWFITDKVIELAEKFGIGLIALKNTNHWMRAGTYGWKAADKGYIMICWTNTIPNLPAWGAKEATTGNNPIVFAVPRKEGNIVLDMAMSQYSYGKLATFRRENKKLPYEGGYDSEGNLTKDPSEIYETLRPLPIGLWKGAGLSLVLDLIATVLSGGKSTYELSKSEHDTGMSQIYIAINPQSVNTLPQINLLVNETLGYFKSAQKMKESEILYPGENSLRKKKDYSVNGIPVDENIIKKLNEL